jgi:hypothetical protein
MAINLSNLIGGGSGGSGTGIYDFHALRRSSDGMLIYTLEDTTSNIIIDVHNQPVDGEFASLEEDYVFALPTGREKNNINGLGDLNDANDKYQQYRFSDKKLRYFIDNDGYMVARLNNNYTYTGPK